MTTLILIFGITSIIRCADNTSDGFLSYLINNKKYENARNELDKLMFNSKGDENSINKYRFIEAYLFQMESNHRQAIDIYSDIINNGNISPVINDSLQYNLAISLFEIGNYETSLQILENLELTIAKDLLYRNLLFLIEKENYKNYSVPDNKIDQFTTLQEKLKKPELAMILSGIIPGLGQVYAKHFFDGLQSFLVNLIGYSFSYISFKQRDDLGIISIFTVAGASMFYLANIISAKKTVYYFNQKLKENFILSQGMHIAPVLISYNP